MNAIAFDTLKVARRLAEAGLDTKTAEGLSETFAEVFAEQQDALATKSDIRELSALMESNTRELRSEIRAEIRQATADSLKWGLGALIALLGLLFAAIKLT